MTMASDGSRPRVLLIQKLYPWPLTNGASLRRLNIIKRLRHRFVFDLYCFANLPEMPQELAGYFDRIISRPIPESSLAKAAGQGQSHAAGETDFVPDRETENDLRRLLQDGVYRIGIASRSMLSSLPRDCQIPIVGDIIDNDCLRIWRSIRRTKNPGRFLSLIKSFASSAAYQRRHFRSLAGAIYVSESDARFSRRITPYPTHEAIPNGVDATYFKPLRTLSEPYSLVFEGNMDYEPNVDAARYLISEILPRIHMAIADVHLYLVGNNPHPDIVAASGEHITVTGFVPDIRPWVHRGSVFVCPMRIGAGIKNKILQAWAMEKPVVTTPEGAGGLIIREGQNIVVRDTLEAFARAVVELLRDPGRARSIGRGGRETVEESYGWEQIAARYGDGLGRIMKTWKDRSVDAKVV